jgi:CRP-like cAMP-binding protein
MPNERRRIPVQNLVLQALPPEVFAKLTPHLRPHLVGAGTILFSLGEEIRSLYFPHSGVVSLATELSDGQIIEFAMTGRESVVGGSAFLGPREAMYRAVTRMEASVDTLNIDVARTIARDSAEFQAAIARHDQLVVAQAAQIAACNATHHLEQRLARWLLRIRDVVGGDAFTTTQEFIAESIGVRRSSVSLEAAALQHAGLISYRRGHIRIERPEALQDIACECYRAIKLRYDGLPVSPPPPDIPHRSRKRASDGIIRLDDLSEV